MAKITREDIKALMKIGTADSPIAEYDDIIDDQIDAAYQFLMQYTGIDTESDTFQDYVLLTSDSFLTARGVAKDISLITVKSGATSLDVENDLSRYDFNRWTVTNTAFSSLETPFYIEYTSPCLAAAIKRVLSEVIIYETKKLPVFDNLINRRSVSVDGNVSETYMTDDAFYSRIGEKMARLFLVG